VDFSNSMKIFTGSASQRLTEGICQHLGIPLGHATIGRFSDGEIHLQIHDHIRGHDVFIVNSTAPPVNDNLMELLIFCDAARRASAERITVVIPYYGYGRQDRKDKPRVPITAKLVANLITAAGADRVLTVDLHCGQIQGFFDILVDHLSADIVFCEHLRKIGLQENLMVVSPDMGSVARARSFANRLGVPIAIVDKRRPKENESEVMNLIGRVDGHHALILDDMIDTGGTLIKAAQAIMDHGALSVRACATHPVFSGPALDLLESSVLEEVLVSDSIPLGERASSMKRIQILTLAQLVGEAMKRIHKDESISSLFTV